MNTAVLAVTPTLPESPERLLRLNQQVSELQRRGLFSWLGIAAVVNSDLYPYPLSYYQTVKWGLKHQARIALKASLGKRIRYQKLKVVEASAAGQAEVAELLSEQAGRWGAGVLVLYHERRQNLFSRLVRSVSEAAAASAPLPVLVLKAGQEAELARAGASILLALDPARAPSSEQLEFISRAAKLTGSAVHVVYVRPRQWTLRNALRNIVSLPTARAELNRIERYFSGAGLRASTEILEQRGSVAEALEAFAERRRDCMIAITCPKRGFFGHALAGSTVRSLIRESKRPTFVLRTA